MDYIDSIVIASTVLECFTTELEWVSVMVKGINPSYSYKCLGEQLPMSVSQIEVVDHRLRTLL